MQHFMISIVNISLYFGHLQTVKYFFESFRYVPPLNELFYNTPFRLACLNFDLELLDFMVEHYRIFQNPPQHLENIIKQTICELIEKNVLCVELEDMFYFLFEECELKVSSLYFSAARGKQPIIEYLNRFVYFSDDEYEDADIEMIESNNEANNDANDDCVVPNAQVPDLGLIPTKE